MMIRYQYQDHPRVCGEKVLWYYYIRGMTGSPPRVRGKVRYLPIFLPPMRITPACAGKSVDGGRAHLPL